MTDYDDVLDAFLTRRDGEGKTADEFTALLIEEEAHRMNREYEERAA